MTSDQVTNDYEYEQEEFITEITPDLESESPDLHIVEMDIIWIDE